MRSRDYISVIAILLLIGFCVAGCQPTYTLPTKVKTINQQEENHTSVSNTSEVSSNTNDTDVTDTEDSSMVTIDILKDRYGNPIQKTVFDRENKYTYIYTFTYGAEGTWDHLCSGTSLTILDENGVIIKE